MATESKPVENRIGRFFRYVGKRVLLIAISLLVSLVLIEIILRIIGYSPAVTSPLTAFHRADSELGWIGIPNLVLRFKTLNFDALVETGPDGFRKVAHEPPADESAPEIWLMGDSTAWGWGVSNSEMFADVIQEKAGSSANVKNFGINAYGTLQESLLLERLLEERPPPTALILMICSNDFVDNLTEQGGVRPFLEEAEDGEFRIGNLPVTNELGGTVAMIGRKSYACSFLFYCSSLFKQIRKRSEYEEVFADSWSQVTIKPEGREERNVEALQYGAMKHALTKVKTLCDQHEIELNLISYPSATTKFVRTSKSIAIEEIGMELGANVVDLETKMIENREQYYIGNGDFHWNAAGNRKGAEVFWEEWSGKKGGIGKEE